MNVRTYTKYAEILKEARTRFRQRIREQNTWSGQTIENIFQEIEPMRRQAISSGLAMLLVAMLSSTLMAADEDRVLFEFSNPEVAKQWSTVNDGVMGGASDGRFKINDDKNMEFFGTLSLENNGGFASVRARGTGLELEEGDVIVARVRGDGRKYNFNLYAQRNLGGYSYRQSFDTKKGEWIEVQLPVDKSVATWRGRVFPNEKLDPSKVAGLGFLLGDKKAGPFKLEVEWIKVMHVE
jgi:monofunctional biosynthetic peptidoglycan transglycosylase